MGLRKASLSNDDIALMELINGVARRTAEQRAASAGKPAPPRRSGANGRTYVDLELLDARARRALLGRLVENDALLPECYFDDAEASAIRSGEKRDAARSAETPEARKALSGLVGRCVKATCSKVAGEPFALLQVYTLRTTHTSRMCPHTSRGRAHTHIRSPRARPRGASSNAVQCRAEAPL